jgi:hypothetical protein
VYDRLAKIKLNREDKTILTKLGGYLDLNIKFGGPSGKAARVDGCDGTHKLTKLFMKENKIDYKKWEKVFKSTGGYCDCEILMNSFYQLGIKY